MSRLAIIILLSCLILAVIGCSKGKSISDDPMLPGISRVGSVFQDTPTMIFGNWDEVHDNPPTGNFCDVDLGSFSVADVDNEYHT